MSKVRMGAKFPRFAAITAEPAGSLPAYGAEVVTIGELIAANLTVNLATGELFSDDALNIKVSDFSSGTIAMEVDGMEDAVATAIYGVTSDDGTVIYNVGDVPPNGGLTYYVTKRDKSGSAYFQGYYFPKVQAAIGTINAQTKGSSIAFQTDNTTFTVMKADNGDWMHTETFETEAEAIAWGGAALSSGSGG